MRRSILSLFLLLLTFASQGTWCCVAAGRGAMTDDAAAVHYHHRHRPRIQVHQELRAVEGEKLLEVESSSMRKLGHGSVGRGMGSGSSGGGRTAGGGGANTRPHNSKNGGAAVLPAPVTSVLALVFTGAVLLPAFNC